MQWDHLRTFEAVARLGSLTAAADALGVSQSTVSRQITRLERDAGSPLFVRETPLRLTRRGEAVLAAVEPMVDAALVARSALEDVLELRGQVTVTTVGEMVRWVLSRHIPAFYRAYPHVRLRLLADNRVNSLAAGDADIALRLARPERGELAARRLGTETYGFFAADTLALGDEVPWLGLTGSLAHIPEQRHADEAFAARPARLLLEDVEALGVVVQAGLGVAVLPRGFASRLHGVVEVQPDDIGARIRTPIPSRDLWMVVHRSKQQIPKIRAVINWLLTARWGMG